MPSEYLPLDQAQVPLLQNISHTEDDGEEIAPLRGGRLSEYRDEEELDQKSHSTSMTWTVIRRRYSSFLWIITTIVCIGVGGFFLSQSIVSWSSRDRPTRFDDWVEAEVKLAELMILRNTGPVAGAKDGLVIASPSKGERADLPDYFYTWTRDSALTISSLLPFFLPSSYLHPYQHPASSSRPAPFADNVTQILYEGLMREYIASQAELQIVQNPSGGLMDGGLNEPKYQVDGSAFDGNWGRPQRDGPALRALAMIPYANYLLDRALPLDLSYIHNNLYRANELKVPGMVIKNDLEEVAHGWWKGGFDLWEEVDGHHLFTLLVSMRALQAGALFARRLNDSGAADYYTRQAELIGTSLSDFWDEKRGTWLSTLGYDSYQPSVEDSTTSDATSHPTLPKREWLDCSLPLSVIHAGDKTVSSTTTGKNTSTPNFAPSDPNVLASLRVYIKSFEGLYGINKRKRWTDGWALGRYREDVYDGVKTSKANPWYLCTFSVAQTLYLARAQFVQRGEITITNLTVPFWTELLSSSTKILPDEVWHKHDKSFKRAITRLGEVGDAFLQVGQKYSEMEDGRMSEQIGREDGKERGARDLTWSYASLLEAGRARGHLRRT
ncbi:hypothetical protein CI109_104686 [Kwoniella shandongensis]|uniref:glucan 1,4-alpha-glucosidase n=1 Tax=Kwoniella shandongensis TaxID=1734106 RepID=A0AAJ8MWN0_9TREE